MKRYKHRLQGREIRQKEDFFEASQSSISTSSKGYYTTLKGELKKPKGMSDDDCEDLDLKAVSAIHSCLADHVLYNVINMSSVEE